MQFVIFGAQGYALATYEALTALYPKRNISCFLVSSMGMNTEMLRGIPVREIGEFASGMAQEKKDNTLILIATPENVQPEIEEVIENYGFHCYQRLDFARWTELVKLYHVKMGEFLPLSALTVGVHDPFIRIYAVRSHKDCPVRKRYVFPEYIFPLQCGRELSNQQLAVLSDNDGDHISSKNGNYAELTGLYWIWKNKLYRDATDGNTRGQYFGLAQYRRILDLTEDDALRLVDNDVDAVLPYPMPYEPNIHEHHKRYLKDDDWKAMMIALRELQPEYADYFPKVLEQQYFYNYNVILAKKEVLRGYCDWLFPVLERTEELSVPKGNERQDRYIGYMGESLETLYFMKNADRLNVLHAGCRVLV